MDDPLDDVVSLLSQNDPFGDDWSETSFLGLLIEERLFSEEGYSDLETTLIRAASEGVDFGTLGVIIRVVERITLMFRFHVDPSEVYRIENLDDEQVAELDKRVRFCLVEISLGNVPDMSRWET
jgi:hypothetical protein